MMSIPTICPLCTEQIPPFRILWCGEHVASAVAVAAAISEACRNRAGALPFGLQFITMAVWSGGRLPSSGTLVNPAVEALEELADVHDLISSKFQHAADRRKE